MEIELNSIKLKCPACGCELALKEKSYICENEHLYDISKYGYINLLLANKKNTKTPGDNQDMIRSRSAFLNKGYYQGLSNTFNKCIRSVDEHNQPKKILDIGCAEGYYLDQFKQSLDVNSKHLLSGIDISKYAIQLAAKRKIDAKLVVANIYDLPFLNQEFNIVFSVFAPLDIDEINRVLRDNGTLIIVGPGEEHLRGLTEHIYDNVISHSGNYNIIDNNEKFQCQEVIEVKENIIVEKDDILDLLRMTPYYWQTTEEKKENILKLTQLNTPIHFYVKVYKKLSKIS
ncbi:MAG: 23S rRNA (guanine745-N1)-methyltransferase [Sulfurimonas sp.]|jgi:23S rRNA (guanine745-N1)-methyltransferase|uniref:putative RNA methyltransferase n=1 Tax=Sulfurimonas sp. TaxID=2022749 RepID=UPI0039E42E7E